jgi:ArsR family transcriptional regulator, arsenate/arsenite/antimonite-responsive transcriptional repressor
VSDELGDWAVLALSALAHDTRLQVHRLLVRAGREGLNAGAIAAQLNLPASSLSFHLAHMQAADMVQQRREGRSLIYSVNFECMDALMEYLQENCCQGVPTSSSSLAPGDTTQEVRLDAPTPLRAPREKSAS